MTAADNIPRRSVSKAKPATAKVKPKQKDDTTELMLTKLEGSCLDASDAKQLGFRPANHDELVALGLLAKKAFELPYFDISGNPTGFKRWRYLEDTRTGFAAETEAKPVRYVQAGNTVSEVYMPPLVDWVAIKDDPSVELVITEGELKAACCTKYAKPCLGLGGVYSFKSAKRKLPLLPIFYDFAWKGRVVLIAFDSDAHTNPMVVRARNALCRELLALGALPYIVNVTSADDDSKRGLDDIVYQEGVDTLEDLFVNAEPYAMAAELHALNIEVAYIKDPGLVVVLDSGLKMRASDFTGHAYSNRHFWEETIDAKGGQKMTKKKAAPAWLEWPLRLELARIVYEPGGPNITERAEYNTWPGWGCQPKKGGIKPWIKLLDRLFAGHPEERSWFERWCALPLQQPGKKMYTASVLWGVRTGTGKSLTGYTLGRIYGENFTEIGDRELKDDRNEWAINKQFVMGDDVTGHEQRQHADKLKKMITQQSMRIDQKYVPSYTVRDCIAYLFTSNHPDTFFLEDDDRRNFVHEVRCDPMTQEEVDEYMAWLNGEGPGALFYHLLHLDLGDLRAEGRAPLTASREAMIDDGLSDLGRWVRRLRENPNEALKLGEVYLKGDLWSSKDLYTLYDPEGKRRASAGAMGKELKRAGIKQAYDGMPVKTQQWQQRLFIVRNEDQWLNASMRALSEHYNATRCGPVKLERKF